MEETIAPEQHPTTPPHMPQERQVVPPPQQEATTPQPSTSQVPVLDTGDLFAYADDLVFIYYG